MEKSRIGIFIDNIFIFFIIIITLFAWTNKYLKNNIYSIIISFIISFIIFKIILYFQNKKLKKLMLEKSDIKKIKTTNFALRTMTQKEQLKFFKEMLKNTVNFTESSSGLIIENSILFIIKINEDEIKTSTIYEIYQNNKNNSIQEIALVCNKIELEALKLCEFFQNIKFTIFTPVETYALMKKYNYFPSTTAFKTISQKPLKNRLINEIFIKKQGKNFIKCGFLLYFSCLFIPFTKYYLVSASLCVLLGALCFCFGKKEIKINSLSQKYLLN